MPRAMDRSLGDGGMPLLAQLGVSFERYGPGWVEAVWTPSASAANPAGIVQGGVYAVVHDAAMNFAANAALERGDRVTTLDLQYQILQGASAGDALTVRGEVVRLTRSVGYLTATVTGPDGAPVSRATATFLVRRA